MKFSSKIIGKEVPYIMASNRSSTETTTREQAVREVDPNINSDLNDNHAEKRIQLGSFEKNDWTSSFGEDAMENLKIGGGIDPVFEAKAAVINSALQHIGMGKYQWKLFALCGFGWVASALARLTFLRPQTICGYKG